MTASVPRTPSSVPPVRPSALPLSFRVEASLKLRKSLTVLVLSLLRHAGISACTPAPDMMLKSSLAGRHYLHALQPVTGVTVVTSLAMHCH